MRNLITGIFAVLAGTFLVGERRLLNSDNPKKSEERIKVAGDSVVNQPPLKSPEPSNSKVAN